MLFAYQKNDSTDNPTDKGDIYINMKYTKKQSAPIRYCIAVTAMAAAVMIAALSMSVPFFLYTAEAAEKNMEIIGKVYEFEEKNEYDITSSESVGTTKDHNTLGKFSISGDITKTSEEGDIPSYQVAEDKLITLAYTCDDSLMTANAEEWHLEEDSRKTVDGIQLDEKIGTGAVILQTSLDREKWTVNQVYTNLIQPSDGVILEKIFPTNEIQLANGCYYRILIVYKTAIKLEPKKLLFIDTPNYDYKKYGEVYEFYASYKSAEKDTVSDNEKKYSLGTLVNTGKDNGYSGSNRIEGDDPHYGWEMGNFFVSGYTEKTDDMIFLKNVGDRITLWFNLRQDIDRLNGNEKLKVMGDKDGYDQYFQTSKMDFGRGTLIIRYTDHEGVKREPIIYENYLEALTSAGADVKVRLFEEGDYEVALDYEVKDSKGLGKIGNYRISFDFKVRNGNCMVYPFDIETKSELTDSSVTENGFYLDLARSKYLKINITMARWTKGTNGYTEDVRYNRPAKNGDQYTEEGIYTIEVSNPSTQKSTEKKIYVGRDNVLIASMNSANSAYSIDEISELVEQGAEILEDGRIVLPTTEAVTEEETAAQETGKEEAPEMNQEAETAEDLEDIETDETESGSQNGNEEEEAASSAESSEKKGSVPLLVLIGIVAAAAAVWFFKNPEKKS